MYITHTPGPICHGQYLHSWNSVGVEKGRHWKHLAESFPKAYRSVLASSWLSSNRAWKTLPGGCDVHRRLRYLVYGKVAFGFHPLPSLPCQPPPPEIIHFFVRRRRPRFIHSDVRLYEQYPTSTHTLTTVSYTYPATRVRHDSCTTALFCARCTPCCCRTAIITLLSQLRGCTRVAVIV